MEALISLYSGHRFCYVFTIYELIPRYSTVKIPDPRDARKLIDAEVTLYYNGQHVICSHCHALEHQVKECTERPKPKCNLCLQEGHTKNNCPTAQLWPTCFRCKNRGHMSYGCPRNDPRPGIQNMPTPVPLPPDRLYRPVGSESLCSGETSCRQRYRSIQHQRK